MINTKFKDRVTSVLEDMKRSKSWLAENLNMSRQALNYLLNQTNGEKYISDISEILNVSPIWLKSGTGDVNLILNSTNTIPLIKLNNVIDWINGCYNDLYETIPAENHETDDTFAITLDNSSMENEFAEKSILIFRISKSPSNGDFVLAALNNITPNSSLVFRKYVKDGSGVYLKALDPTYRAISDQDKYTILGTLIEQRRRFYD